jgi:hypothetical protein
MLDRLQTIPRYYVYLLLAAVVVWQILYPIHLPIVPSASTRGVIDAIKAVPDDKLIIISTDWDASTQAETGPQTKAIIESCFQNHKRFAIMNLQPPVGVKLANDLAESAAKRYSARYGIDWCNWGYKYGYENVLLAMQKNIPLAVGKDFNGTPVAQLPMMKGVKNIRDIGLVVLVTGLANMTEMWVGLIQTPFRIPLAAGYTAVMAPGYYAYLDSDQLKGILVGAKGAAELESAVGRPDAATAIMNVQSWAHLLIIALIILGNVGQTLARKSSAETGR